MMPSGNPRELATPKHFVSAFAPFPRSTWIHPHVPHDNFDRVCRSIWGRVNEAKEELGGGHSSPERQMNKDCRAPDNKPSHRAEEQQKEPDDLGRSAQYEEYERQYQTAYTRPAITLPAYTRPAITLPAYTRPAYTRPAYTRPAYTRPAYTRPAYTRPAFTRPAFTRPAFTRPAFTLPNFTRPAYTLAAFTLPCPYPSVHRSPHVATPARELNPVMEEEMKRNEEAKGNNNLSRQEEDLGDKQSSVANYAKRIWVPQSSRRGDKRSSAPEPQPPATNPVCFEEDPQPATCKSENVSRISSSCDSNSSDDDDDFVPLPRVRSRGTDSDSDGDSESKNNDGDEEENEIPHPFDELSSDSEQDSPSSYTDNFPPLPTIQAGILPCPTEPLASGKTHSQWEIPLSFYPHDIPTATLASGVTAHAQAPVQGKAEAPEANSQNNAPPAPAAAPTQQEAPDLLADFPALQPPKKPLLLGVWRDGHHKTKGAEGKRGHTHSRNECQESGASHQRRMENVPHEVSSIYAGHQKSVLDLQTFGRGISPTISCGELKANNQPPPRVAGTDGLDANARSWADAAKAGMKQAAAPQEKARPCTLQQTVTINRAKAFWSPG